MPTNRRLHLDPLAALIGLALAGSTPAAVFNVNNNADSGTGSLRWAVSQANSSAGADTIDLAPIAGQTINLSLPGLSVTDSVLIQGAGVTVTGTAGDGIFSIVNAGQVDILDLTLTGASRTTDGGAIYCDSTDMTLQNSVVTGNTTNGAGGGLAAQDCFVAIEDSRFLNNATISSPSSNDGGGIMLLDGGMVMTGSLVEGNETGFDASGGGIRADEASVALTDSIVRDNVADADGGGLLASDLPFLDIQGSQVDSNQAASAGGVFVSRSDVSIGDTRIVNNRAIGGALFGDVGGLSFFALLDPGAYDVDIVDTHIAGNEAARYTGGFYARGGNLDIQRTTIDNNEADGKHGGAYVFYPNSLLMTNCTISSNTAETRAGLTTVADDPLLRFMTITGNTAQTTGGGWIHSFGPAFLRHSVVYGNSAAGNADISFFTTYGQGNIEVDWSFTDKVPIASSFYETDAATASMQGIDPQLQTLKFNGGATPTHAIPAGSPAVDWIPSNFTTDCGFAFSDDQRGEPRPVDGNNTPTSPEHCDAGAFERKWDTLFKSRFEAGYRP